MKTKYFISGFAILLAILSSQNAAAKKEGDCEDKILQSNPEDIAYRAIAKSRIWLFDYELWLEIAKFQPLSDEERQAYLKTLPSDRRNSTKLSELLVNAAVGALEVQNADRAGYLLLRAAEVCDSSRRKAEWTFQAAEAFWQAYLFQKKIETNPRFKDHPRESILTLVRIAEKVYQDSIQLGEAALKESRENIHTAEAFQEFEATDDLVKKIKTRWTELAPRLKRALDGAAPAP